RTTQAPGLLTRSEADFQNLLAGLLTEVGEVSPRVTRNPSSLTVNSGQMATFTAQATGTSPSVQWQVSTDRGRTFLNLAGATSPTLSFAASAVQNGYQYRAVFTNVVGDSTSKPATLKVR